jgi:hypothetical protein
MVAVRNGQGQEAIPDPSFDLGSPSSRSEPEVTEFSAGLEASVHEILIHRHHLERADDLVAGGELRTPLAGDGGQLEQVVAREIITAQRHYVTVAEDKARLGAAVTELDERASGSGFAHCAMLKGLHLESCRSVADGAGAAGRLGSGRCIRASGCLAYAQAERNAAKLTAMPSTPATTCCALTSASSPTHILF